MAKRTYPVLAGKLAAVAYVGSRPKTPKTANSKAKMPIVMSVKVLEVRAMKFNAILFRRCCSDAAEFCCGRGCCRQTEPTINIAAFMNARARMDHAQPTLGSSDRSIRGMTIPPIELPHRAIPIARPRRWTNHFPMTATPMVEMMAAPKPPQTAIVSMKCQYCVHSARTKKAGM